MDNMNKYNRAHLDERQIDELIGLARGIIADGIVSEEEVHFLHKWLVANKHITSNTVIALLFDRITEILSDGIVDENEKTELLETLTEFSGSNFEIGEVLKSTTLPICSPAPEITFSVWTQN